MGVDPQILEKYRYLLVTLRQMEYVAVAFSGGVDSTFLLQAAAEALGDRVIAVTANASWFSRREQQEAEEFCKRLGIRQIHPQITSSDIAGFTENPKDRCYLCKKTIFSALKATASRLGNYTVVDGSNMDDNSDYRPGIRALRELEIRSPLQECCLYKEEIRILSRYKKLPTWDKPSFACLASRFPYGEEITDQKLSMVESGEEYLRQLGFTQYRVRIHGNIARIEILPDQFDRLLSNREDIVKKFQQLSFSYVTMDLRGFRSGSMNEVLQQSGKESAE